MPRPRRNETRKKTLFEREHGCRIPVATSTEAAEFEESVRLGIANAASSTDPSDYRWDGGRNKIDADAIIACGLSANSAPDDFLLKIIDRRTNDRKLKSNQARKKSEPEFHIEQVNRHLLGRPARRGASKPNYEPVLTRAAELFHPAYFGFSNAEASQDEILSAAIWSDGGKSLDPQTKNNRLKPYRREWKRHRDRLLLKVTEEDSAVADKAADAVREALAAWTRLEATAKGRHGRE